MRKHWKMKIDERQQADLRRVESYGYWIAFWLLLAAVLIQSVILQKPAGEWIVEWLIFMVLAVYGVFSCIRIGVWTEYSAKPTLFSCVMSSLVGSLGFSLVYTAGDWFRADGQMPFSALFLEFFGWFIGLFLILLAAFLLILGIYLMREKRLQKQMDAELEEEEHEEL